MQSITLQTSDTVVTSGDILGRLNYAASAEADGSAAILIAGSIYVQAEGSFQSSSNPSAIVFATAAADSSSAVSRLKINDGGNLVPVTDTTYNLGSSSLNFKELHSSSGNFEYINLQTDTTLVPQIKFTGSGVNDTPINLEVASSFQSATGSGTALLFQGTQGQLFSITDNLSSGTIFNVSDITGLPMLEVTASGDVEIGEFADNITIHQPVLISGGVPTSTTNKLYNNAGTLYFNGSALGGSYDDTYVSGVATYASGQAIENETQISSVSGWAGANVTAAINDLVDGAPAALDTLNELAAAINDDASYAATITTALSTKLENVVEDTTPQLGGTLDANGNTIDMGTNTITDTKVGQWDTAYGWGDHSTQGYLTADDDTYVSGVAVYASGQAIENEADIAYVSGVAVAAGGGTAQGTDATYDIQPANEGTVTGNARGESSVDLQTQRSAATQVASGGCSTISGGQNNTASGSRSTIGGGCCNTASGTGNVIGGGGNNTSSGNYSTIGGGGYSSSLAGNTTSAQYTTISGGAGNCASDRGAVIGGGVYNTASASYAIVVGGLCNTASGARSVIGGGCNNTASNFYAIVGGGLSNTASGNASTVGGGVCNTTSACYSTVAGGFCNTASAACSAVGGGIYNTASGTNSAVTGGNGNYTNARHSVVSGHKNVIVSPTNECCSRGATISGGIGHNSSGGTVDATTGDITGTITCCNAGAFSTISGGCRNVATGACSTIGGGRNNTASGQRSTVSGGYANIASNTHSTVGGGCGNTSSGISSTVGGGSGNNTCGCPYAVIAGGDTNTASHYWTSVGGGRSNVASAQGSTVGGGRQGLASGDYSTISGGCTNTSSGARSTVSGGYSNTASGLRSTIGGGSYHTASANNSTISGGSGNTASASYTSVGGGIVNCATSTNSTISGGYYNTAAGTNSVVTGGNQNYTNARHSVVSGHKNVIVSPTNECCSRGATISGGIGHNSSGGTINATTGDITGTITCCNAGRFSTIGGGCRNIAIGGGSTVSGGSGNTASGYSSTVSGGASSTASGARSVVGGGQSNTASGVCSAVGGGYCNTASCNQSTIGGGALNVTSDILTTVGGGQSNTSSLPWSTVSGGYANTACNYSSTVGGGNSNTASGTNSTVGGGQYNTASGSTSTVTGGGFNIASATNSTVSGGYRGKATRYGETSHAAGRFAADGDAQHTVLVARKSTTDATANQVLLLDGSSARLTIPAETTWMFTIKLAAHNDTNNDGGWWYFRGGIARDGSGNTSLIGSVTSEYSVDSNISTATAEVVADDTNDALEIRVTGVASKSIRWVAVADISQVSWGTP